jgi:outer membrane protein TolC
VARLKNTVANLEVERSSEETRLNTLLNRDPETPLGSPELGDDMSFKSDIRSLYQAALLNQPDLIIFSYAIEKNKYAVSLAKRSYFPDVMATIAERGITSGTIGPWDLMLAFTVPLWFWTKQRYQVKEAIANVEEAQAAYTAMQNKAFAEVKDLAAKIEVAKNKAVLSKTELIPMIESSIEVSLSALRTGKLDVMTLLDSQRMLVEEKLNYYRALVDYNMNLADLKRAVGTEINQ